LVHTHEVSEKTANGTHSPQVQPLTLLDAVEAAADLLPDQAILENFIHHNPLKHFECMKFREALEHVHRLESYMSPAERVFLKVHIDPRKRVNEALVDLSAVFLDRGAAKWAPKFRDKGFLLFFASLESLGFALWRKQARVTAERILAQYNEGKDLQAITEDIVQEHLEFFGVPKEDYTYLMRSMLLELRGWAGMFHRMQDHPEEAPMNVNVRLIDFLAVQMIFTRSSIEDLGRQLDWDAKKPLADVLSHIPVFRNPKKEEPCLHASAIAYVDQHSEKREALETEFKHALVHAIGTKPLPKHPEDRPMLQLYTCIDDREGSFRRHLEEANPDKIETFGVAGFFGIPIQYKPADGRDQMILAPEGQHPTAILVEDEEPSDHDKMVRWNKRRKVMARLGLLWENASFSPIGSLFLSLFFPISMARQMLMGFSPAVKRTIKEKFFLQILEKPKTDFVLPFPPEQAASMLARTFKDIGTHKCFAPIVMVLGHGAASVNNPFAAAYNCGACGGREGGTNARLLARLANDTDVRRILKEVHGVEIPEDTVFIGGIHNTTTDCVEFYDLQYIPQSHMEKFIEARGIVEGASGRNALERCHRFMLAEYVHTPEQALWHVKNRSEDAAEVRPELNHATNAAVVVGRRDLTKGRFLDRRVFLPSYDPFSDDDEGTNLEHVLAPALVVCSGINLEYLFSTIDVDHHGAGTKAPLNIVGNIGVLQGTTGDLRPGLPSQMTEMHTPIRALFMIDSPVERVEAVLARREDLRQLVRNEWVRLFVRDPGTDQVFKQSNGEYFPIDEQETVGTHIPFTRHYNHGIKVAHREALIYWAASLGMLLSCAGPIYLYGMSSMNPHGALIAGCGTLLALPVLAFAHRYLHGEFMFGRFSVLCVGLLLGFNLVATAPSLEHTLAGWSLFGFASAFLIGAYNDRPTVKNNATFAFAAYRVSDFALLIAATFSSPHISASAKEHAFAAAGLLLAAIYKSSQFPLQALFARSMEGPTPASALGYAGLSAHVGIVLLTGTMPLWFCYDWARVALAVVGIITAVHSSLTSKIRADRKGAIANATSATLGCIFVILALGYSDAALLLCLGHAAFRMTQVLRSPNVISDSTRLRSALGHMPWPKIVPDWLYKLCWRLHRISSDFHLLWVLHLLSAPLHMDKRWKLSKVGQWLTTAGIVVLAGAPFTPLSHYFEEVLMDLLPTQPYLAGLLMAAHFTASVLLVRLLLVKVLDTNRFRVHHKHVRKIANK
jgi:uncharacterized protein YbcC (UPF0753/DUF2309 family)